MNNNRTAQNIHLNHVYQRKILYIVIASSIALACSYIVEFGLNRSPCLLCQTQRMLWVILLCTALTGLFRRFALIAKKTICFFLVLNVCVAAYHTLVQFHIFEDRCPRVTLIPNIETYKKILTKHPSGCAEPSWTIAKLPAPFFNCVASFVLLLHMLIRRSSTHT